MARLGNRGQTTVSESWSVPDYSRDRETVVCPQLHLRGFTLLELLVVMALLGIATLLAVGGAEPVVRAARERGWVDRLQAELIRTRSYSRASGTVTRVSFVPELEAIRFVTGSRTKLLALPDGFRFETAAGAGEQTVIFFPDGTASDLELVVTGSAGRATRLRVVGVTGKVELAPFEKDEEPPA